MNKEQLRKELEDCWDACLNAVATEKGSWHKIDLNEVKKVWITTRLAALDDGKKGQCNDPAIYYKDDLVDDGQEGKVEWNKGISGETLPDPKASDNVEYGPPAPEKLEYPQDLIKSLNWCKNLLSSITAATIAGRDLDFVKHGTQFFEEMLMAYQSAKSVLKKYDHLPALPVSDKK